jgi:large subunit ribosomal protein L28
MVTGKKTAFGNNVSHSNRKTRRTFKVNARWKRFWVASENRFARLSVSSAGMRIIDKLGIDTVLLRLRGKGLKV